MIPQESVDMDFREMISNLFNVTFITPEEMETFYKAGEMYAEAKVKNANKSLMDENKELKEEKEKMRNGLIECLGLIKQWHNMPAAGRISEEEIENMWQIYFKHAPEMKRIQSLLNS